MSFRQKLKGVLEGLRWRVEEASGGAEALLYLSKHDCVAMILDSWLPDLEVSEFLSESQRRYPGTDVLMQNMSVLQLAGVKNSRRQELWYALRCSDVEGSEEPAMAAKPSNVTVLPSPPVADKASESAVGEVAAVGSRRGGEAGILEQPLPVIEKPRDLSAKLPEIVGSSPAILELCRQIRLVAPEEDERSDSRADGDGKRAGRVCGAPAEHALAQSIHCFELRGDSGDVARVGALWTYEGCVYGRGSSAHRPA